jgi:hypothetical protein
MRAALHALSALAALATLAHGQVTYQRRVGEPIEGLSAAEFARFLAGRAAFDLTITPAQGRGPIFNDVSCGTCHRQPRLGGSSTRTVTRFGKRAVGTVPFDPLNQLGGSLLQSLSISPGCAEFVPAAADITAARLTPHVFGAGLVEAILDGDLDALAQNPPAGVSGQVHWVQPLEGTPGQLRAGRFGWKNQVATVTTFSADAAQNELGFTNSLAPNESAPNGNLALLALCDSVPDPEDLPDAQGVRLFERFTDFQRYLAPPPQTPRVGMSGESLFNSIGCAACHVATPYVSGVTPEAALSQVAFKPYSDFLLHDMGSLGDGIVQGAGTEKEMATRALWGLRLRASLLHDGRATGGTFAANVTSAINFHDGEGAASRAAFLALSPAQRNQVIEFLGSLGQAEFDIERDHDVDEIDWFFLESLLTGPGNFFGPDDSRAIADVDADGDFDLRDFLVLQAAFTGDGGSNLRAPAPATVVNFTARSAGQSVVQVTPGASVPFEVVLQLAGQPCDGLAGFAFDLDYDAGALSPLATPSTAPFDKFVSPLGLSNAAGFGGAALGGDLVQVGGAQNTIQNLFAPKPSGPVIENIGTSAPAVLASGTLTAPSAPGSYFLRVRQPAATVILLGETGTPFWHAEVAQLGLVTDLRIDVVGCVAASYCTAKVDSAGCTPAFTFQGSPSLGGADDFVIRAAPVRSRSFGLLFTGSSANQSPFRGGVLCVAQPLSRVASRGTFGNPGPIDCSGALSFDVTHAWMQARGLSAGDTLFAQWIYRDAANPDGSGVGLSGGLSFTVCP